MFDIPTTREEMNKLGIKQLDVILVSGDAFVDHPSFGTAIIARVLKDIANLKVGIICQPDWKTSKDITRLGEPKYFFGVTSGNMDSMVANYTASRRKRKTDEYTPNADFGKRPDRATIVYSNLIKQNFKGIPVILGGIEASLRRISHYDWWQNKVKKSFLLDSKADLLVYGMGEKTILQVADIFKNGGNIDDCKKLRGVVFWKSKLPKNNFKYKSLPSFEEVSNSKEKYMEMFKIFQNENDPLNSDGLIQKHDNRFVIQNPPQKYLTTKEMDMIYDLPYTKKVHPYYKKMGYVKALDTVKTSITSHRGCYGECSFCAITLHQGRTIQSRSIESILNEIKKMTADSSFNGIISDIGGPTANMYGHDCSKKIEHGACKNKRCIGIKTCNLLKPNHSKYIELLKKARKIKGIKKIFVASGIRLDLIFEDKIYGMDFLKELINHHISGRMKIAPEHASKKVLNLMNKPDFSITEKFIETFKKLNKESGKKQFFSAYIIAAHPGSTLEDEKYLKKRLNKSFGFTPNQVQIFTPTPSTKSTTMYYTEKDPNTNKKIFVEKNEKKRKIHKEIVVKYN
ncbi:UPF0313 protein [Tepiditoga spiralis]|uniref:UPF0313 protein n=1 Tax=Tepiditoga spiralis TaxID=2108365 RepID=A0A7G1G9K4_9BACT|nr:YgiQ family radical SAM protein [Tepiditoga spiralis]BBE31914.1 UPF0313 protein [Tepiditoga spiralis]